MGVVGFEALMGFHASFEVIAQASPSRCLPMPGSPNFESPVSPKARLRRITCHPQDLLPDIHLGPCWLLFFFFTIFVLGEPQ